MFFISVTPLLRSSVPPSACVQLFVTEIRGEGCGLHNWQGHSTVVRATSASVMGPYKKQVLS